MAQKTFEKVALGGTFDVLHDGHKKLLSTAASVCSGEMIIGVADGPLLKNKVLRDLIGSFETRSEHVREYLSSLPTQPPKVNFIQLEEPYGPTITDASIQCIVLSEETRKGGVAINTKRAEAGMAPLEIVQIDLVDSGSPSPSNDAVESVETKVSSSTLRKMTLGKYKAIERPGRGGRMRCIGLTGGIATGKTSAAAFLKELGAAVIDCDVLGHRSYAPGTECLAQLVKAFGDGILAEDGTVARPALGKLVFGNPENLQRLNSIVWPQIGKLLSAELAMLEEQGTRVCVVEAAVLLEAGWETLVDEVWVMFVPSEVAVARIQERNKLSQEDAERRVGSQLSNRERLAKANLYICSQWDKSETQKQLRHAWKELQSRLA